MKKPVKILKASAGSGKTFNLAAHYLTLLFGGENKHREILAVTFTNKATEEMKSRILEVLKGLAKGDEAVTGYKNIILEAYPHLTDATLQQKADTVYRHILHDYSRFAVSTIDGFVQKVIRGFAFELGLSADYALELNLEKVKDALLQKLDDSLSSNKRLLNWIIQLALEKIEANKSWNYKNELRTIINEIFKESFEDFENSITGIDPLALGALFKEYIQRTKQTISDYEEKRNELVDQACEIFDRHAIDSAELVGKSRSWLYKLKVLKEEDDKKTARIWELIDNREAWFKKDAGSEALFNELNPVLKNIKAFQDENRAAYKLALAFNQNLYYLRLMQEIVRLLSEYRNENGNLLISDAQKLVTGITDEAGDNPSFIWEKVGNRYRHFLFDEFQDTSTRQWRSFRSLLSHALSSTTGRQTDHLIVGDTKQSIYRWRSGDWNILHRQAKTDIGVQSVAEDSLEENYRSTKEIINFNNQLYRIIPDLLQTDINNNVSLQAQPLGQWWNDKGYDGIITKVYNGAGQKNAPSTPEGGKVKIQRFEGDKGRYSESKFREDALALVVQEIRTLHQENKYALSDIAILVRSNHEAELCVDKLLEQNIPVLSGDALLIARNPAIDLVINTLRVFIGIDSETALYKANCIALYHAVHNKVPDISLYFDLNKKSLSLLGNGLPPSLCDNWKNWLQLPLAELTENIFESYDLTTLTPHIPYLLAFRDMVSNATRIGEKGIIHFLEWWEEEGAAKALPSPEGSEAVQIITIHKSKGLAFRAVFIPFCIWDIKTKSNSIFWVSAKDSPYQQLGSIPLQFNNSLAGSTVSKAYFEELLYGSMDSLNMLYVATTRAKDFLSICTMDQKKEEGFSKIGNAVNQAVTQIDSGFSQTGRFESGEVVNLPTHSKKERTLSFTVYPFSERLSRLYENTEDREIHHLFNTQRSEREGLLAHEILANAGDEASVKSYLNKLLLKGVIRQSEVAELQQKVMEVLWHPQIAQLFERAEKSLSEKSIIDSAGKSQRPDRILFYQDSVVLLDYKFTAQKERSHEVQIRGYKKLLEQIGYQNVTAYLFYAVKRELIIVD